MTSTLVWAMFGIGYLLGVMTVVAIVWWFIAYDPEKMKR